MNNKTNDSSYYNLITSGRGYLRRARWVEPGHGDPFLSCSIHALVGSVQKPETRYFDVNVVGSEAKDFVERYVNSRNDEHPPLVQFRIGDVWADGFRREVGKYAGQIGASLKGRLIRVELLDYAELANIKEHELLTNGVGYLNSPVVITPDDSGPFLQCTVAALVGKKILPPDQQKSSGPKPKKQEYRYFLTSMASQKAENHVNEYTAAIKAGDKVSIAFTLSDMQVEAYIPTQGENVGKPAGKLKSSLLNVSLVRINGEEVYREKPISTDAPTPQETVASDSAEDGNAETVIVANDLPSEAANYATEGEAQETEPAIATAS